MEKLINSIKLISFNYMYSSNKTVDKFGIEYSYIASAMNSMLKSTNISVKNINVDQTIGIAVDYRAGCIVAILAYIASIIFLILLAIFVWPAAVGLALFIDMAGGLTGFVFTTLGVGCGCFGGW